MTSDEREALQKLGALLLGNTVVLVRTDSPGRGSGVGVPWKNSLCVITARHVIEQGEWALEVAPGEHRVLREACLPLVPMVERRTLLLPLKADRSSFDATTHDIAWATLDFNRQALGADPHACRAAIPVYLGPLNVLPSAAELYTFVATNRDELHKDAQVMVREAAAEAFMTYLREEDDGVRFALARTHQGDAYYRGSSGAPVADRSGAIVGVVSGGRVEANELVVAGLARFIEAMKLRE